MRSSKSLLVNLKISERCNLNCSYCYFFNGKDQSYKAHPKSFSRDLIIKTAAFLKEGCIELGITDLDLIFHGGEPLLYAKNEFDWMCEYFNAQLKPLVNLNFSLQTNGTLINSEWADLFLKHNVGVGISIDGPQKYNDLYRFDHFGKGSHHAVVKGIKLLQQVFQEHAGKSIGALCVINPEFSAREIYQHLSKELNLKSFDFILPDYIYDNPPPHSAETYGNFLIDLFNEWTQDPDQDINIRILSSSVGRFFGYPSKIYGLGRLDSSQSMLPLITISTNGDLAPLDELRSTDPTFRNNRINISKTSLKKFLKSKMFDEIALASETLPEKCSKCCWGAVCEGGGLVYRYSSINKFNNPSIYCDGLMNFFSNIAKYLLENGFPLDEMKKNLMLNA